MYDRNSNNSVTRTFDVLYKALLELRIQEVLGYNSRKLDRNLKYTSKELFIDMQLLGNIK